MVSDEELYQLSAELGRRLQARAWRVATAESCTGGWLAKCLTDVPGSSNWFERGYVTYSNSAKESDLGVPNALLQEHGAVSAAVIEAMAAGALRASDADLALAISGVAGPDGGTPKKPVGLVWFGLIQRGMPARAERHQFAGDRAAVRRLAVRHALQLLLKSA